MLKCEEQYEVVSKLTRDLKLRLQTLQSEVDTAQRLRRGVKQGVLDEIRQLSESLKTHQSLCQLLFDRITKAKRLDTGGTQGEVLDLTAIDLLQQQAVSLDEALYGFDREESGDDELVVAHSIDTAVRCCSPNGRYHPVRFRAA